LKNFGKQHIDTKTSKTYCETYNAHDKSESTNPDKEWFGIFPSSGCEDCVVDAGQINGVDANQMNQEDRLMLFKWSGV
jgi:hypothetical protein